MENLIPIKIHRPKPYLISAEWSDGFNSVIKLEKFRGSCPCADCRDDELESRINSKTMIPTFSPGKNDLKKLTPVGNYAINALWGDDHDTGIYPWDYFRDIFERYRLSDVELSKLEDEEVKYNIPELKMRSN